MTPGLIKMWIALSSMVFMFIAVFSIYLSRYKIKSGILKGIVSAAAYLFMISAGILMIFVVFSGPVSK
ncbi:DUF2768 domain-containing protein [Bacillus sp. FJAT-42376]|uniref:DUF2768 domain-containing protein n=1 Tax=Bacillus sp. FJAT-42376 TaxID=2014076 RepID=UPI000F50DEDA|nr:DUF2768 domain-containing protein [Bacillus sp. FJAT-42376]AZB43351.1 DUF2768 domain-containing protein [Bacillus sp. FJAT-42376]